MRTFCYLTTSSTSASPFISRWNEDGEIGGHLYHFLQTHKYDPSVTYDFDEFTNNDADEEWYQELERASQTSVSASLANIYAKIALPSLTH